VKGERVIEILLSGRSGVADATIVGDREKEAVITARQVIATGSITKLNYKKVGQKTRLHFTPFPYKVHVYRPFTPFLSAKPTF
jgi:hypothetical protein